MKHSVLSHEALERALDLRDLTDPLQGPHAMQRIVNAIHGALAARWGCRRHLHRAAPIVAVADNYDRLGYPPDGAARDARYTRYVTERMPLRTHTSAAIPGLLRAITLEPPADLLLVCPGLVYRRDAVDRLHTGEPHQLDLWRVKRGRLGVADLEEMVAAVVEAALPDHRHRVLPTRHPYTEGGLEIEVLDGARMPRDAGAGARMPRDGGEWIEVGECGLAAPKVLAAAGLDVGAISGLAMGLGLDRLVMLRKGIDDIRLLRSKDRRIAEQMQDLEAYESVSDQPPIRRDLSVAVERELVPEEVGDCVRETLHHHLVQIESVEVVSETPYDGLPTAAHLRMGMRPDQKNLLLRLTLRDPVRTLTRGEANRIRDLVYRAVHRGTRTELAGMA